MGFSGADVVSVLNVGCSTLVRSLSPGIMNGEMLKANDVLLQMLPQAYSG